MTTGSDLSGCDHNLRATPTSRVQVMGQHLEVRAVDMSADEAAAFWPRLLSRAPGYER